MRKRLQMKEKLEKVSVLGAFACLIYGDFLCLS